MLQGLWTLMQSTTSLWYKSKYCSSHFLLDVKFENQVIDYTVTPLSFSEMAEYNILYTFNLNHAKKLVLTTNVILYITHFSGRIKTMHKLSYIYICIKKWNWQVKEYILLFWQYSIQVKTTLETRLQITHRYRKKT